MTKKQKREKKKKDRGFVEFMMVQKHFFKDMPEWIEEMEDPRNPSYITYTQADFINMGILKNICALESMRQMGEAFNEENSFIAEGCLGNTGVSLLMGQDCFILRKDIVKTVCVPSEQRKKEKL